MALGYLNGPMRPMAALRFLPTVLGADARRRAAIVTAMIFVERVLTPLTMWALVARSSGEKLALPMLLGALFLVRGVVQKRFAATTEADLCKRVSAGLLDGDVLRANVLSDEDARAELTQAVHHLSRMAAQDLPNVAASAVAAAGLGALVVATQPARILVATVVTTIAGALVLIWAQPHIESAFVRAWSARDRVVDGLVDAIEGRLDIVAAGRRSAFLADFAKRADAWSVESQRAARLAALAGRVPLLAIALGVGGVLALEERWAGDTSTTLADVAVLASVAPAFVGAAQGLQATLRDARWARMVARIVASDTARATGIAAVPRLPAPIEAEHLYFRYEGSVRDALRGVSFRWRPGRVLGLAGPNGSGKSTCLRLVLGLAEPTAGAVTLGGVPLSRIDGEAWRARTAFLAQRPYLPARATVREAIRFVVPDADDASLLRALDRVGPLSFVRRCSGDPLDTRIDALSVGEKQRVALARLLVHDAPVVLLDEPDANLDRAGIALVAEIARELAKTRMLALAAHTPELLAVADDVVILGGESGAASSRTWP